MQLSINILYKFLETRIRPLGDSDYQLRVWINQEGNEVDDYDESITYFINKCEEMFAKPSQYEGLDEEILSILRKLYEKVTKFDDEVAVEFDEGCDDELIATPEWKEIQKLASKSYTSIHKILKESNYERK